VNRYFAANASLGFTTSYENPTVQQAIQAARATSDVQKRKELYATTQRELITGTPFLWLYVGSDYVGLRNSTKGFVHLPTGSIGYVRQTWLDK
jgi:ABC-type transport system substrate-binding protein